MYIEASHHTHAHTHTAGYTILWEGADHIHMMGWCIYLQVPILTTRWHACSLLRVDVGSESICVCVVSWVFLFSVGELGVYDNKLSNKWKQLKPLVTFRHTDPIHSTGQMSVCMHQTLG